MLLTVEMPYPCSFDVTPAGYVRDLGSGIVKRAERSESSMASNVRLLLVPEHPFVAPFARTSELLLVEKTGGELSLALKRSVHWWTLARSAEESAEEVLLLWLAGEAVAKISKDESGVGSKFVSALGFPHDKVMLNLCEAHRRALQQDPSIKVWRKYLVQLFGPSKLERARNEIVHSGFRELDLFKVLTEREVKLSLAALRFMVPRLHGLALTAISMGISSLERFWKQLGPVLDRSRQNDWTSDILGTVIYGLNNANKGA